MIFQQYTAAVLVILAKSIIRFDWIRSSRTRADRFLIGTLANATTAVAGGLIAYWLSVDIFVQMFKDFVR